MPMPMMAHVAQSMRWRGSDMSMVSRVSSRVLAPSADEDDVGIGGHHGLDGAESGPVVHGLRAGIGLQTLCELGVFFLLGHGLQGGQPRGVGAHLARAHFGYRSRQRAAEVAHHGRRNRAVDVDFLGSMSS